MLIDVMKSLSIIFNAFVFGAFGCSALKCGRRYPTLCMQTPPTPLPATNSKCLYALFPESRDGSHESLKESLVKIDDLYFNLDDNVASHAHFGSCDNATSDGQNDVTTTETGEKDSNGTFLKIGSKYAFDGGANADKRRSNHLALVELALVLLKCDAMVLPVDAQQLLKGGCCNIYQLQLAKAALFLLKQCSAPLPRIHFVIYSWQPNEKDSDAAFIQQQKKEIHKILLDRLDSKGGVSTTCSFSPDTSGTKYLSQLASVIKERVQYKDKIKDHYPLKNPKKQHALQELVSFYKWLQNASGEHIGFGPLDEDIREVRSHSTVQASIYYILAECKQRLSHWFEGVAEKQMALDAHALVTEVDFLCDDILLQYDTQTKELAVSSSYCKSAVADSRKELLEFIGRTLGKILQSVAIHIHENTFQEFKEATSKLILNSQLAENLESLVQEYDEQFCCTLDRYRFRLLKNDKLHNIRREAMRLEFLDECTQLANHVLEYAISKGYFYHKPNVLDGIRWLRRSKYLRWLYRIYKRIKIPISLSVHYLSRNAFGFSDKFRCVCACSPTFINNHSSRKNLGPKVLRYFTS